MCELVVIYFPGTSARKNRSVPESFAKFRMCSQGVIVSLSSLPTVVLKQGTCGNFFFFYIMISGAAEKLLKLDIILTSL